METSEIIVRFWAGARAAAGVPEMSLKHRRHLTVSDVVAEVLAQTPADRRDHLARVVGSCSVLLDDLPLGTADPASVEVQPGQRIELLPPFAGG